MLSAFVAQSNNAVDAEADERNAHRTMKSGILVGVLGVGLLGCGGRSELELRGGEVPDISGAAGGSATLGPPACAPHAPGTLLWSTIPDPGFCSSGHAVLRGDAQGDARVEISESDQQIENAGPSPKDGLRVSLTKLDAGGAQQWNVAVGRVPYTGSGHSALATDRNDTARVLTPRPIDPTGLQPVLSTVSDAGVRTATPLTKNPEGRWWPVAMQTDVALATAPARRRQQLGRRRWWPIGGPRRGVLRSQARQLEPTPVEPRLRRTGDSSRSRRRKCWQHDVGRLRYAATSLSAT